METLNQWIEEFLLISKEEANSPTKIYPADINRHLRWTTENDKVTSDGDKYNNGNKRVLKEIEKKFFEQRERRMNRMRPLFASQPRLEKVCKDWTNEFVDSGFTTYNFSGPFAWNKIEERQRDVEYLIDICGCNLTSLHLSNYVDFPIEQLINCPNLTSLVIKFKDTDIVQDFDNLFSNMRHLETLMIYWFGVYEQLPLALAKSVERVSGTLKTFSIVCEHDRCDYWDKPNAFDGRFLAPGHEVLLANISTMVNLEWAIIKLDCGVTDEWFINITNNCKNLKYLNVRSSRLTDKGLIAINNLKQLKYFYLGLTLTDITNEFITDQSVQWLCSNTLEILDISNCTQVTDDSVIELMHNLPNLRFLHLENTSITREVLIDVHKLSKYRKHKLFLYASSENL